VRVFVCLFVCGFVGLLPRWLEIACIDLHQTRSVREGSDHLQLIKFWPSCAGVPPGTGSATGRKFLAPPYFSQRAVFASLWALFMRPSSLGGGRILRRTLSVCLSVCLSVRSVIVRHVAPPSELQWHTCTTRAEGRISYGHLGRTDSCFIVVKFFYCCYYPYRWITNKYF